MTRHRIADVYKAGVLAARLERFEGGTRFAYLPAYLAAGGEPVASTLPLTPRPVDTPAGAVPPFFTGLLPEGRRLASLRRAVKTSADDELGLLMAAGGDPVGDVQIVPHGEPLGGPAVDAEHAVELDARRPPDFAALVNDPTLVDPKALAGVQDKVSAGMISLPAAEADRRYILKLNAPEFPHVVENEFLMYRFAARLRVPVCGVRLVHDVAGRSGLLVERFDRPALPGGGTARLAVEDGSQLLGLYPADKYNVSYEELCQTVAAHCSAALPALRNLALQGAFAWLVGNGDLHAKNVSVVRGLAAPGEWTVAPVYDIPSTVPYGDKSLALPFGGKRTGISRRLFLAWATELGLPARAAVAVVETALKASAPLVGALEADDGGVSPFAVGQTRAWVKELKHRRRLFEG
ncbi:type II toxin-antitoxin system HipA family toxin [Sinomonas sp. ASV322]|uniref:type II toxin-antitoxin system HipA family toxin n=1 Tax=Sinomonas sp. ASV322 TaxID=3041920 RepID=UPI0027DB411D|nr:type II toxin-antitoxin system HipA family toxin [Sinomonas sp. ASV322]MDQ4502800.1 type II toxin-antitoxin system HipA family toxin [Sinomonas sp. ASV322]